MGGVDLGKEREREKPWREGSGDLGTRGEREAGEQGWRSLEISGGSPREFNSHLRKQKKKNTLETVFLVVFVLPDPNKRCTTLKKQFIHICLIFFR